MKKTHSMRARLALLAALCSTSVFAVDVGPLGTGIMGVNNAIDGDAGTPHSSAGTTQFINDSDPATRVDTWAGANPAAQGQGYSYVGVRFPSTRYESVTSLALTLATFFDGGWFGVNGTGPAAGGALTPEFLREPTVQITTDGATWTTVPHTSDYMTVMNGHGIGGGDNPNPSSVTTTFTLNTPVTSIRGIRLIGLNGGAADGDGFLGVFDLTINANPAADTDSDGLPDPWEQANSLSVGTDDSGNDPDTDTLTNLQEFNASTNPRQADTDGDGLNDGAEINTLTNPNLPDSDGDGLTDGAEVNTHSTDPTITDTDGDTLSDGAEVNTHHTDPMLTDTDNDGYGDAAEVAQGSDPTNPAIIPNNIALFGRGIMGVKDAVDSGIETEEELFHVGAPENIVDGKLTTRVDTYNADNNIKHASYVGVVWDNEMTNTIATVRVVLATFFDGGWFGPNGTGPGAGNALTAAHLTEPRVEVTTDGGGSWNVVPATSDYISALTGHRIGGGTQPNPTSVTALFTLTVPTNGINGIRVVGSEGGQASGGFLGIFEFAALTSSTDVDNDKLDDAWERQNGLNVGVNDAAADPDTDGLTNLREFEENTNPQDADSDNDGLNDGPELNTHNTHPLRADTDTDGLDDGAEVNTHRTNPLLLDTDGDLYNDGLEVAQSTNPLDGRSFPANIAPRGTAILGTSGSMEEGTDVPYANAGSPQAINDFNLNTRVDTFGGVPGLVSYVGLIWNEPLTNPLARLDLSMATFYDGGWFGPNNAGPGGSGALSSNEFLLEPTVQVTTDKGTTWQTVAHTSDYLEAFEGHTLPATGGAPTRATATFTLTTPQASINGVRIVGSEGGTASGGFIGVFELAAFTGTVPTGGVDIKNLSYVDGQIRFNIDTIAGKTHYIEYANNVDQTPWAPFQTITGDGSPRQITDGAGQEQRYYRVRTQ